MLPNYACGFIGTLFCPIWRDAALVFSVFLIVLFARSHKCNSAESYSVMCTLRRVRGLTSTNLLLLQYFVSSVHKLV
jgi:hypothetical protein